MSINQENELNRLRIISSHLINSNNNINKNNSTSLSQLSLNNTNSSNTNIFPSYTQQFQQQQNINMSNSIFGDVPTAPADPILGMTVAYNADKSSKKVNLGVGAYRTNDGKPFVLRVVKETEKYILEQGMNKEYIPQDGLPLFKENTIKLLLGDDSPAIKENRVAVIQSISGTGALRLGFEFIKKFLGENTLVYVPHPTWGNHFKLVNESGLQYGTYRYYDPSTKGLDLKGFLEDLSNAKEGSVVLLHSCAHNPSGVDPDPDQWKQVLQVVQKRRLIPFFDTAYQGFASGDLHKDAFAVRYFVSQGLEIMAAQSYAKNFGLYGERIGSLDFVCNTPEQAKSISSQVKLIVRGMYSSPPLQGARIVGIALSQKHLFDLWDKDLKIMANRIAEMRSELYNALLKRKTPGDWTHILKQKGMFTFTGLSEKQVDRLINEFHIYLLKNGRISVAGLNTHNLNYVADCIHTVVTEQ